MTRTQELDDILDDLDDIDTDTDITIGNFNRLRKKREPQRSQPEEEPTSFQKWVDTRKGGENRKRRDG